MTISFTNILPNPDNGIGDAGQSVSSGGNGLGYKSVKLSSENKVINSRTNSGKVISRTLGGAHKWKIDIGYNPMTREEFDPIYSFLLDKRGSLTPFFVSLPQYKAPRDTAFASYVADSNQADFLSAAEGLAGTTNIMIDAASDYNRASDGTPKPGDIFTFDDSMHTKTYQITKVETQTHFLTNTTGPSDSNKELRIHFIPALQKTVSNNTKVNFHNPMFRVIQTRDTQSYNLNTDNLYSFSISLEEVQR